MELVATEKSDGRLAVTLADDTGLLRLEGSVAEVVALCDAMEQAAVLAGVAERPAWLATVPVGDEVVRLGVRDGRVRMLVGPAQG
jgi:hypothetical protein